MFVMRCLIHGQNKTESTIEQVFELEGAHGHIQIWLHEEPHALKFGHFPIVALWFLPKGRTYPGPICQTPTAHRLKTLAAKRP